jgi:hypothetical protein
MADQQSPARPHGTPKDVSHEFGPVVTRDDVEQHVHVVEPQALGVHPRRGVSEPDAIGQCGRRSRARATSPGAMSTPYGSTAIPRSAHQRCTDSIRRPFAQPRSKNEPSRSIASVIGSRAARHSPGGPPNPEPPSTVSDARYTRSSDAWCSAQNARRSIVQYECAAASTRSPRSDRPDTRRSREIASGSPISSGTAACGRRPWYRSPSDHAKTCAPSRANSWKV